MTDDVLRELTEGGVVLEIPRRFKSYEVVDTIGVGGYAVVVEVRDVLKGQTFAAKVMSRPKSNTDEIKMLESELRLGVTVSHRYLVKCVEVVYLEHLIIVVMESVSGKDLFTLIRESPHIVVGNWKKVFKQLCLAVRYLHAKGLAHRDLKPENVLVDDELNVKLCDYGFLCEAQKGMLSTGQCGTLVYMAPEMIQQERYDAKATDVWALGIMLYTMLTGRMPWVNENQLELEQEIMRGIAHMKLLSGNTREIVMKCCDLNQETRATIDQVVDMLQINGITRSLPSISSLPKKNESGCKCRARGESDTLKVPSSSMFKAAARYCVPGRVSPQKLNSRTGNA